MDTCENKVKEQRETARAVVAVISYYILTTSPHRPMCPLPCSSLPVEWREMNMNMHIYALPFPAVGRRVETVTKS